MKNLFNTFAAFLFFTSFLFSQPDTLTILHVNDSHSTLEAIGPRDANLKGTLGGVSRVATLVGLTKMTEPNVLFLHAGDHVGQGKTALLSLSPAGPGKNQ